MHIVGGASHSVAYGLQVVKGHALAEQADVQLFAHVALKTLPCYSAREIAAELYKCPSCLATYDSQSS